MEQSKDLSRYAADLKLKLDAMANATVSVAMFGQPGSGKSSLVNRIVGERVAEVGVETDKTVSAESYECHGLRFVDLPGYGTSEFPKETFLERFDIDQFDLFLCVTSGKLHATDSEFFQLLSGDRRVCLFVVNKHDELWEEGVSTSELESRKVADIRKQVKSQVEVLFTSCRTGYGVDSLIRSVRDVLAEAKRDRWLRSAKVHSQDLLEEKRQACEKLVAVKSAYAAANGLNPIPGLDVGIDVGILMALFSDIREAYGLSDKVLDGAAASAKIGSARLAQNVLGGMAKEGVALLLKQFAGREVAKSMLKYIPLLGTAVSASIGYALTSNVGRQYLDECHQLASEILEQELSGKHVESGN